MIIVRYTVNRQKGKTKIFTKNKHYGKYTFLWLTVYVKLLIYKHLKYVTIIVTKTTYIYKKLLPGLYKKWFDVIETSLMITSDMSRSLKIMYQIWESINLFYCLQCVQSSTDAHDQMWQHIFFYNMFDNLLSLKFNLVEGRWSMCFFSFRKLVALTVKI